MAVTKNRDGRGNRSVTLAIGSLELRPKQSAADEAASTDEPQRKTPPVPRPTHATLMMGTSAPRTPAEWATRPLPGLGTELAPGSAPEPTAPPRPEGTRPLFTASRGPADEKLPMSDEDISKAIATFGPMGDSPTRASVEVAPVSRSDIPMEIEESDEVEVIAGTSATAQKDTGPKRMIPSGVHRLLSPPRHLLGRLVSRIEDGRRTRPFGARAKWDRARPLDTQQVRRKYRVIAAIIGVILAGACFAVIGLFLRDNQAYPDKRITTAKPRPLHADTKSATPPRSSTPPVRQADRPRTSPGPTAPVASAPVAPHSVTATSPVPDPIPQPPTGATAAEPEAGSAAAGDTVVIHLSGLARGATVFLEEKETALPLVVPRSQKIIKIEARAPGYRPVVKRIIPGTNKTVRMKMSSISAAPKKSPKKPPRSSKSSRSRPRETHRKR